MVTAYIEVAAIRQACKCKLFQCNWNYSAVIEVSSRLLSLSGYSVQLESAVGSVSLTGKRKEFSALARKSILKTPWQIYQNHAIIYNMDIDALICKSLTSACSEAFVLMAYLNWRSFKPQVGVLLFLPTVCIIAHRFLFVKPLKKNFWINFNLFVLFLADISFDISYII